MRFAVLSDTHDQVASLQAVLARLATLQPDVVLLCGDITQPQTLLAARLPGLPLAFCLGNCDAATAPLLRQTAAAQGLSAWGDVGLWHLEGQRSVAFTHFPALAERAAASGEHQAVFFGHTHRRSQRMIQTDQGPCLLANPGDIQGRHGPPGALLWDSTSGEVLWV